MSESSVFVVPSSLAWTETVSWGVRYKVLHHDDVSDRSSLLLEFAPGAAYALHRHPEGEEYLVLEGSVEDGGEVRGKGTYVRHPGSSAHRLKSREGCLLFVSLPQPIEILKADE